MFVEGAGPLRVLKLFSVPKRDDAANEDRWCVSADGTCCVVSDGASISFDSGPWAEVLCRKFIESSEITPEWLDSAVTKYQLSYDRDAMSWSHQAAFDRGSFATLLGVVSSPDGHTARIFALGDTLLAFIDKGQIVRTIPYVQPDEFDRSPTLISTNRLENKILDQEALNDAWYDLVIASHEMPVLLLMTDAIGRWLLDEPTPDRVAMLLNLRDAGSFHEFVEKERSEGRLRRDDSTLLVVG
jgi:Protein phosphatase 2C